MRESGNLRDAKKSARIRLGIPAVNMRRERRVMMMYASLPTELREVIPRKSAMRVVIGLGDILWVSRNLGMAGMEGFGEIWRIATLVKR